MMTLERDAENQYWKILLDDRPAAMIKDTSRQMFPFSLFAGFENEANMVEVGRYHSVIDAFQGYGQFVLLFELAVPNDEA